MNVRIFTLKFNRLTCGFDDTEVRTFVADKEVLSIRDHAFVDHGVPHLALVVTYRLGGNETSVPAEKNHADNQADNWRKMLGEADMPLFNTLREWRSRKAKEEGVPTYFVCTNRQLAEVARLRPGTMTALARVDGFGTGRLKKYGQEILAAMGNKVGTDIPQLTEGAEQTVPTPEPPLPEPPDETGSE
ncbi:MAG: HRDC domain-containing protein [Magnetococcales bacterium]|nr:HRDC domain-containing protein [Magnetococcales bacterium]